MDEYFRHAEVQLELQGCRRFGRPRAVCSGSLRLGDVVDLQEKVVDACQKAESKGQVADVWWKPSVDPLAQEVWVPLFQRRKPSRRRMSDVAAAGRLLVRCEFISTMDRRPMGPRGFRAIHRAASGGHEALVRVLSEQLGEDLWQTSEDGLTALDLAAQGRHAGHVRVIQYIVDQHSMSTLERLASGGSRQPVGSKPRRWTTPLHHACAAGCVESVEALRVVRAWFSVRDIAGRTPFAIAAAEGHTEVLQLMTDRELASPRDLAVSDAGDTPLMQAAQRGHLSVVNFLVDNGTPLNTANRAGETALSLASALPPSASATAVVKALLAAGARQEPDFQGRLPIHRAAAAGNVAVMELFGPDNVDVRDNFSMAPVDHARRGDDATRAGAVEWLRKHCRSSASSTSLKAASTAHAVGNDGRDGVDGSEETKEDGSVAVASESKGDDVESAVSDDDEYVYVATSPRSRATLSTLGVLVASAKKLQSTAARSPGGGRHSDGGGSEESKGQHSVDQSRNTRRPAAGRLSPGGATAEAVPEAPRQRSRRGRRLLAAARRAAAMKGQERETSTRQQDPILKRNRLHAVLVAATVTDWRRRAFLDAVSVEGTTGRSELAEADATEWEVVERAAILRIRFACVQEVASMTHTHQPAAGLLLAACDWDTTVLAGWFLSDFDAAKRTAGIHAPDVQGTLLRWLGASEQVGDAAAPDAPQDPAAIEVECEVCMCEVPIAQTYALGCGHTYCMECWSDHLTTTLDPSATLRPEVVVATSCMAPDCGATLDESDWRVLLPGSRWVDYEDAQLQAFVAARRDFAWCPSACGRAVRVLSDATGTAMDVGSGVAVTDVQCACGTRFCFQCGMNVHSPADCDEYAQWNEDRFRLLDAENYRFLMQRFKRCPKCKAYTERNRGCNHMTCRCGHHWCFMCKGPWSKHGAETGGYYKCLLYQNEKKGMLDYEEYTERDLSRLKRRSRREAKREAEYTRLHTRFELEGQHIDRMVDRAAVFEQQAEELEARRSAKLRDAHARSAGYSWQHHLSAALASSGAAMPRVLQDLFRLGQHDSPRVSRRMDFHESRLGARGEELPGRFAMDPALPTGGVRPKGTPGPMVPVAADVASGGDTEEKRNELRHREAAHEALAVLAEAHRVRQWLYVHEFFAHAGEAGELIKFQHEALADACTALDSLCDDSIPLMSLSIYEIR